MQRKLSNSQVKEIVASKESVRVAAKRYGVSFKAISQIRSGETYRRVRPSYGRRRSTWVLILPQEQHREGCKAGRG